MRALSAGRHPLAVLRDVGPVCPPGGRMLLAFLRVTADLESSVDLYALAASEVYDLGGETSARSSTWRAAGSIGVGDPR